MSVKKLAFTALLILLFGMTIFIPERHANGERVKYLNAELLKFSAYIGEPGFGPEHPEVQRVFEEADVFYANLYREKFTYASFFFAPMMLFIAAIFMRHFYNEVALVISFLVIFLLYHGGASLIGSLLFIFLFGCGWMILKIKKRSKTG